MQMSYACVLLLCSTLLKFVHEYFIVFVLNLTILPLNNQVLAVSPVELPFLLRDVVKSSDIFGFNIIYPNACRSQ